MNKHSRRSVVFLLLIVILAACASPAGTGESQSSSVNDVATTVAMTLQALAPETADLVSGAPESSASLLPQRLYFLGNDQQSISQIYRLERDGKTKVQLTFELFSVTGYDISPADGSIVYVASNQLLLIDTDGSNRRVLVDGGSGPDLRGFYRPIFSPDGKTLAFARGGLVLYDLATGVLNLAIEDQMNDIGDGHVLPVETYAPVSYSPDGKKLLLALGHWEVAPSHAVYDPATNSLVRHTEVTDYIYCCSFHGGPVWAPDSSAFYGVASVHDSSYKEGELWRVDAGNGEITRSLRPDNGTFHLPKELYVAPDGQLYFFQGTYRNDSGYFDAPVLQMVRAAPDGVTNRTVLRSENFVMMNEALWAPDASFVVVSSVPGRDWDVEYGVLELYGTQGQNEPIWLASSGQQMKWGP